MALLRDFQYAVRLLTRSPAFAAIAIGMISVATGANIAIFSFLNGILLHPLPYPRADSVVSLHVAPLHGPDPVGFLSLAEFRELSTAGSRAFDGMALYAPGEEGNLAGAGEAEHVRWSAVQPAVFGLLGIQPAHGRTFLSDEDRHGRDQVAVISQPLWQRRFGARTDVLGRTIHLNDRAYTVIGVMSDRFQFEDADIWVPLVTAEDSQFPAVGRMRPGVTVERAEAALAPTAASLRREYARRWNGRYLRIVPVRELITEDRRPMLWVLMGAVGFVLLMTCANLATLLLARGTARSREMAIRSALGASRWRVLRQLLTESLLLALLGGLAGVLAAAWALDGLKLLAPADLPRIEEVRLDWSVLLFTLGLTASTGILFGLAPAVRTSKPEASDLKRGGKGGGVFRTALVSMQVGLSVVLLAGAGLMIRSLARLNVVPLGIETRDVVTFKTTLGQQRYSRADRVRHLVHETIARIGRLPGVRASAATNLLPLADRGGSARVQIDGEAHRLDAVFHVIDGDYFRALGIPVIRGRTFAETDKENSPCAVVVNRAFVRRYLDGREPLGRVVRSRDLEGRAADPGCTIAGVVGDVRQWGQAMSTPADVYYSLQQVPVTAEGPRAQEIAFVLQTNGSVPPVRALQTTLFAVDKEQPVHSVLMLDQLHARRLAPRRFVLTLLSAFSAYSILLAAFGVFASISNLAAQRRREFAVRVALGARSSRILTMVLGQSTKPMLIGVGAGVLGAAALSRSLVSVLFEVEPIDIPAFLAAVVIVSLAGLAASLVPARNATRVEPMAVLRTE